MRSGTFNLALSIAAAAMAVMLFAVVASGAFASQDPSASSATGSVFRVGPPAGGAGDPATPDVTAVITANCRYGLTGWEPYASWIAGQKLGQGTYLDFSAHPDTATLPGAEYFKMVKVQQNRHKDGSGNYVYDPSYTSYPSASDIASVARTSPGSLWLIGNEPDRGPNTSTPDNRVQDDTYPDMYAVAYHDLYALIKQTDPTAQVANAGLVEVTPGRLNYLDQVWQTYLNKYGTTMPVDVWNIHVYPLAETYYDSNGVLQPNDIASAAKGTPLSLGKLTWIGQVGTAAQAYCSDSRYYCVHAHGDVNEFANQVIAMRNWMAAKGERNKPLIITEMGFIYPYGPANNPYGCFLYDEWGNCFTPQRAGQFLQDTFNWMNSATDANLGYAADGNRLVQQWMWFNMYLSSSPYPEASIMDPGGSLSLAPAGNAYKNLVLDSSKFPQTMNFVAAGAQSGRVYPAANGVGFDVTVNVYNNGSIAPDTPVNVSVYSDAARTRAIGSAQLRGLRGCARRTYAVTVPAKAPPGTFGAYPYYVTVNPGNAVGETSMADNYAQGSVNINIQVLQFYLPLIMR